MSAGRLLLSSRFTGLASAFALRRRAAGRRTVRCGMPVSAEIRTEFQPESR